MNRNVEIKAKITENLELLFSRVAEIADHGPTEIFQDDTFFTCPNGRLKLRAFSVTEGELIFYQRSDGTGPKESRYTIFQTASPVALREVLLQAYGDAGRVRTVRTLFMVGRTRIHIDRVDGLGNFLELEVVLAEGEPVESGVAVAHELLGKLGLSSQQLIAEAYVDLLAKQLPSAFILKG